MLDPLLTGDRAAPPRTLLDILGETTERFPDAPALDDTRAVLSYADLTRQARRTAAELAAAGVRRGDRVGVRVPSGTLDLYVAILGVMHAGAAYVPVDVDDPPERADLVFASLYTNLRLRPPLPHGAPLPHLTDRERECLHLVALGKSDQQIGETLKISDKTANFHIESAKRKFQVSSRTLAAIMAAKAGVIRI